MRIRIITNEPISSGTTASSNTDNFPANSFGNSASICNHRRRGASDVERDSDSHSVHFAELAGSKDCKFDGGSVIISIPAFLTLKPITAVDSLSIQGTFS